MCNNGGTYFYYHCTLGCKERVKASDVNEAFRKELSKIITRDKYITLFEKVAEHFYRENCERKRETTTEIQAEIGKHRQRMVKAQQLMLDGELNAADYREIKNRYEPEISQLERRRLSLNEVDANLMEYVKGAGDLLRNLPKYYNNATLPVKQKIIGSIYPGKLIFEKNEIRTTGVNEVINTIRTLGKAFEAREKEMASKNGGQSEEEVRADYLGAPRLGDPVKGGRITKRVFLLQNRPGFARPVFICCCCVREQVRSRLRRK